MGDYYRKPLKAYTTRRDATGRPPRRRPRSPQLLPYISQADPAPWTSTQASGAYNHPSSTSYSRSPSPQLLPYLSEQDPGPPPRTSTQAFPAYNPPDTTNYSRTHGRARTSSYSQSRAYSPDRADYSQTYAPPQTSNYHSRSYDPPQTTTTYTNTRSYIPVQAPRASSPVRTTTRDRTRARSRSRSRTRNRTRTRTRNRSRVSCSGNVISSALDSVPQDMLQDFGYEAGRSMARHLGWDELDGRTTEQRAGRDRYRRERTRR
ncbi:hypothetical protein N658DRAFT_524999 [Parathielavia hyrcaniae]|uniref:Uncharacterized protein n=1 Tax=Parathielavia hyrcaniae TaxID=113614 RepID=A0AAN6PXW2_9PEZI|nr:hypothetical protein N658DRAFT_524999 [Parathielavia hyrcaniae]